MTFLNGSLFLAPFRLLTADLCKANSHLSSKVHILEERLSAIESELAVQKAITAVQVDHDSNKKKLRDT